MPNTLPRCINGCGARDSRSSRWGRTELRPGSGEDPNVRVRLKLVCEGRRSLGTYKDEPTLRGMLRAAAPVMLAITLESGA